MRLEPIANMIERETNLEQGATLFIHHMPETVKGGVLLMTNQTGSWVDHEIRGRYRERFQVIVRDNDYVNAVTLAEVLYELVWNDVVTDFGDYTTSYIRPLNRPIPYRRLKSDQMEVSINFEVLYCQEP